MGIIFQEKGKAKGKTPHLNNQARRERSFGHLTQIHYLHNFLHKTPLFLSIVHANLVPLPS